MPIPLPWRKRLLTTAQAIVHLGALLPLLWLFIAIPSGAFGGDPVKELIHYLGLGALRLLMLTLLISPLAVRLKNPSLNRLRRPLGLWCFTWASLHFAVWLWLDLGLEWSLIGADIVKRSYILLGFSAWLVLLALAITSLPRLVHALGARWKALHGLIYPTVLLGCIHFWWSLKSGWLEPVLYLGLALVLLGLRKKKILTWLGR